jgi:hypothetical protein
MGYPVAYLSGNTTTYETGMFKRGTIGQNQAAALTGSYRWWNGIDVTSSQYLIYSDTFTTSATTAANATPAAWSTPDLADQSLLNLINTLPERVGKLPFTYLPVALQWIQSTGRYFLTKNGYENIVTNGLIANLDAGWYLSYSGTGTNWKDLNGSNNGTLINGPSFSSLSGGSLVFDGVDDYALIPIQNYSSTPTITVEGFIKWQSLNGGMFLGFDNNDVWTSSNTLGFNNGQSNVIGISAADVSNLKLVGNFAHYVFVMKQNQLLSTFKMYINTIPQTLTPQVNSDGVSSSFTDNIALASWTRSGGGGFNGNLQFGNLRIYNRELSLSEITQNFNAQKTRFGFTADTIVTSGLTLNLDAGNVISYPTTGTSWYDVSYVNNNATLNNGPTFSNSGVSSSIVFDGVDDYVSGPNLLNGATKATLCGWVKRSSTSSQISFGVLDYPNLPTDKRIEIVWYSDGNLYGEVGNTQNDWVNTTQTVNNTNWHHISFVYDGTQPTNTTKVKLYFDGVLKTNTGSAGTIQSSVSTTGPMVIGRRNTGYNSGNISTVQFYNRNLSDAEILQNYNAQKSRYGL